MAKPEKVIGWKVVLLCFIGAATFWFFSALGKQYSYRIKYPIEFGFDTDSLIAVKPLPEYVDVDVSGGGWDLFKESFWFGADPVLFELENPAAIRFLTRPTILPIITEELSQYRVNFLFTDTLFIDVDRKSSVRIKLAIDSLAIPIENNYRIVSSIVLDPDSVTLSGPTSFLDSLGQTYPVYLDDREIDENFNQSIELDLPEGYEISSDPLATNVRFLVERFNQLSIETTVETIEFPEDSSVFVSNPRIRVQFVIQESKEKDFFADDFKVIVDYNMINKSDSTAPAIIMMYPEDALEVEIEPDTISVTYAK